jgi:hypothetical protein
VPSSGSKNSGLTGLDKRGSTTIPCFAILSSGTAFLELNTAGTPLLFDFNPFKCLFFSLTISPIFFSSFYLTGVTDISTVAPVVATGDVSCGVCGFSISFGGSYRIESY